MTRTRRPLTSPVRAALAAAVVTVTMAVGGALGAAPAQAHAGLTGSNPQDGATLTELPSEVALTFSEDVRGPATIVVTGPDQAALQTGEATTDGNEVRQTIERGQAAGQHTVAYRVISADGHPITGQVRFTLEGSDSGEGVPSPTPSADGTGDPSTADEADDTDGPDDADGTWSVSWLVAGGVLLLLVLALVVGGFAARVLKRQRNGR